MVHRSYVCHKAINSTEYLYVYLFYKKINTIHCYAHCMTQITISPNTYCPLPCILPNSATFYHQERYFTIEFDISDQRWQIFNVPTY